VPPLAIKLNVSVLILRGDRAAWIVRVAHPGLISVRVEARLIAGRVGLGVIIILVGLGHRLAIR